MTLGHEVSGVVAQTGANVKHIVLGQRVCLHYMVTCGHCEYCNTGHEQFCTSGAMIGKYRDGGYAEYIAVPARSVFALPDEVSYEAGAIMMCSSATAFHALQKARLKAGETVAVFGVGGLGMSAVQLARALGALKVFAIDINPERLALASQFGALPINAAQVNAVDQIRHATDGRGVDVAVELIGLPLTMHQAVQSLAIQGRAALAGITQKPFEVTPYYELINREAEIIGVSDHLASEIPLLLELARLGKLDLAQVVTRSIPLDANSINQSLDNLDRFGEGVRVVITPGT
jgi:propanol-preferring alcohol dehydrogenase